MKKDSPDNKQGDTYSKRNKKKKAKFQCDDKENYKLVDEFVQDVIERAKCEYLRQCTNHHGDGDVTGRHAPLGENRGGDDEENGRLFQDASAENTDKGRNKRKHTYKYSDPVDEKEISAYQKEDDALLKINPNFGQQRAPRRSLYDRTVSRFQSLLGCCLGKT